jgi:hypothetical protein
MPTNDEFNNARQRAIGEHYLRARDTQYNTAPGQARNVVGVGIGRKLQGGNPAELSVRFYVERKIRPLEAIDERFRIPSMFPGGIPSDVIETRRFMSFDSEVAPGANIGVDYSAPNVSSALGGTLTAIVKVGDIWYALGSNHVMAVNGRVPLLRRILFKPPQKFIDDPDKYIFARVAAWVPLRPEGPGYDPAQPNTVDCALAVIENPQGVTGAFPSKVVDHTDIADPEAGDEVIRVDDQEEVKGTIEQVGARVRIAYGFGTFDFDDMVLIKGCTGPFASPGDSGALVVKNGKPCAMIVGGSQNYAVACKLSNVRDGLKRELTATLPEYHAGEDNFELVLDRLDQHVQAIESSIKERFEKLAADITSKLHLFR